MDDFVIDGEVNFGTSSASVVVGTKGDVNLSGHRYRKVEQVTGILGRKQFPPAIYYSACYRPPRND